MKKFAIILETIGGYFMGLGSVGAKLSIIVWPLIWLSVGAALLIANVGQNINIVPPFDFAESVEWYVDGWWHKLLAPIYLVMFIVLLPLFYLIQIVIDYSQISFIVIALFALVTWAKFLFKLGRRQV